MDHNPKKNSENAILVIDDEVEICQVIGDLVVHLGYQAVCSHSAEEGILKIRDAPVVGIISDIRMGPLSGIDLLTKLHKNGIFIPLAFVTGMNSEENLLMALRLGAIDLLVKPFSTNELSALIHKLAAIGIRNNKKSDLLTLIEASADQNIVQEIKNLDRQIAMLRTFDASRFDA